MPQGSVMRLAVALAILSAPAAAVAGNAPWCFVPHGHDRVDCGYYSVRACLIAASFRLDGGVCARNHPTLKPPSDRSDRAPRR